MTALPAPLVGYFVKDGVNVQITAAADPDADLVHLDRLVERLQGQYQRVTLVATTENVALRASELGFSDHPDKPKAGHRLLLWKR